MDFVDIYSNFNMSTLSMMYIGFQRKQKKIKYDSNTHSFDIVAYD